jgi:hypothetical protein
MAYVSASEPAMLTRLGRDSMSLAPARSHPTSEPETLPVVFEVICERAGLDALEPEWNDLFRRAGRSTQLFQCFNWNWHWANHYLSGVVGTHGGPTLAIFTVRREGRLVMLWPLVLERAAGLRVLRWMGEPVSQYGDVLVEDLPDSLRLMHQAWRFIAARLGADVVCLRKVRADAAVAPLLRDLGMQQTAVAEAPYLDLASAPDFAGYELRYTAKARSARRLAASEQGRDDRAPHRWRRGQAPAGRRAQARVDQTHGPPVAGLGDSAAAFFADIAEGRVRPAGCGVTVLKSNGAPAGIAIDITCGERRAAPSSYTIRVSGVQPGHAAAGSWIRAPTLMALPPSTCWPRPMPTRWTGRRAPSPWRFRTRSDARGRAYVHVWLGARRRLPRPPPRRCRMCWAACTPSVVSHSPHIAVRPSLRRHRSPERRTASLALPWFDKLTTRLGKTPPRAIFALSLSQDGRERQSSADAELSLQ